MKTTKLCKIGFFLGISGLAYGTAFAADNCNGRWTNVSQSAETIDLGKGHTLVFFVARGSSTSDNNPIYNASIGSCGGYVLTTPDGKSRLSYACLRKNKDGDSWSDAGGIEPGSDRGTWTQTGGTGVFAGKNSSGWWQAVVDDGKVTSGIWGGNCK